MSRIRISSLAAIVVVLLSPAADAVPVDGTLDPDYGQARITQSIQTGLSAGQITGDNNRGELDFANGSELDAGHAYIAEDTLHLFLAGNLALVLNQNQNGTIRHVLEIFLDTAPGGQNTLNGNGAGDVMNGLGFDPGFAADYRLQFEGDDNGFSGPRDWTARLQALPFNGGGTLVTLGRAPAGGPGTLIGGTNPNGIRASIDNRNVGGVTLGCADAIGDGVTRGIEWEIPLAAIGSPQGCIRITAMVRSAVALSNQVLAPLPIGTCPPGQPQFVNFASHAGDQFFTVCPGATGVPGGPGAATGLALSAANPLRGDRLRVTCALVGSGSARLTLVDAAGRVWRDVRVEGAAGRSTVADLSAGRVLAPGVYWLRLAQGSAVATRAVTVVAP